MTRPILISTLLACMTLLGFCSPIATADSDDGHVMFALGLGSGLSEVYGGGDSPATSHLPTGAGDVRVGYEFASGFILEGGLWEPRLSPQVASRGQHTRSVSASEMGQPCGSVTNSGGCACLVATQWGPCPSSDSNPMKAGRRGFGTICRVPRYRQDSPSTERERWTWK